MAKTTRLTWEGANPDFTNAAHWNNGAPVNGDTIGTIATPGQNLLNRPAAGTFSVDQQHGQIFYDTEFLNGAAILNVSTSVGALQTSITGTAITGNVSHTAGLLTLAVAVTGTLATNAPVVLYSGAAFTGAVTLNTGGTLVPIDNAMHVDFAGGIVLAGGTLGGFEEAVSTWDVDTEVAITGTGTIDWTSGLAVFGLITSTGITHTNTMGAVLTVDKAGTLALGTNTTGVQVNLGANITIAASQTCYGFTGTGFTVTWTGTPTVTVGAGGFTKATTDVGKFNLTFSATASYSGCNGVSTLTVNPAGTTVTATGNSDIVNLAGAGTLALGTTDLEILPAAQNWLATWTGVITVTTGFVQVWTVATDYNPGGNLVVTGTGAGFVLIYGTTNDRTMTWTGDITAPELRICNSTANKKTTLNMTAGSKLTLVKSGTSTGSLKLGDPAATTGAGVLSTNGVVVLGGGLLKGNAANSGNAWTLNSSDIRLTGTFDGRGGAAAIAFTNTGAKAKGGTIDYVTSLTGPAIKAYRAIDGGHNTAGYVRFLKRLGSGSGGGIGELAGGLDPLRIAG